MEKEEIIITLSGRPASGKYRLTFLLKEFLRDKGFDVKYEGNYDFPTEMELDEHMTQNSDEMIQRMIESRVITIGTKQLPRNFKKEQAE